MSALLTQAGHVRLTDAGQEVTVRGIPGGEFNAFPQSTDTAGACPLHKGTCLSLRSEGEAVGGSHTVFSNTKTAGANIFKQRSNALDSANLAPAVSGSGRPHTDLRAQGLSTTVSVEASETQNIRTAILSAREEGSGMLQKMNSGFQTGYKTYCFPRKGILGTDEMNGSRGSMEKFINFTQSKGHGHVTHSSALLHRAQMCRTDNPFFHGLGNQPIAKLQIRKAKEVPWTWRALQGTNLTELASTTKPHRTSRLTHLHSRRAAGFTADLTVSTELRIHKVRL